MSKSYGACVAFLLLSGIFCLRYDDNTMASGECPEVPFIGMGLWMRISGCLALGGTLPQLLALIFFLGRGYDLGSLKATLSFFCLISHCWISLGIILMANGSNDCPNGRQIYSIQMFNLWGHYGTAYMISPHNSG